MEATLKFNLPEEEDQMRMAINAMTYWSVLWDLQMKELRGFLKYGHEFKDADEALEWVREYIADSVDLEEE